MNRSTLHLPLIALLLTLSLGCGKRQPTPRIEEGERTDAMGMPLEITISDIPPVPPEIVGAAEPPQGVKHAAGLEEGNAEREPIYGLPLVIDTLATPDLPDVPPEIMGPSQPQDDPAAWRRVWRD